MWDELYQVRNIRPGFRWGLWAGLAYAALDTYILRGRAPWTLRHHADYTQLDRRPARRAGSTIRRPDGKVTFDRLSSVFISNTNHEEDQPPHLQLRDPAKAIDGQLSVSTIRRSSAIARPASTRSCRPTGRASRGLQINAQNCVHCKTCDIKDPTQNIDWVVPEGGGGPNYPNM